MKVSRNWLQTYFKEKLPLAEKLAELFTFHAFEVEGVEEVGGDEVLDLKVLPDRAHYALSHLGIAREITAISGLTLKHEKANDVPATKTETLSIAIEEPTLCRRYVGRRVHNISVKESPAWLKEQLEAIGQRSINTVVDATNFVMFDIGQPLHAFDADKVRGSIVIRKAKKGETIALLPEKVVGANGAAEYKERVIVLTGTELVIADDDGPIALAGVKGGLRAAVTSATKNIIIESANFDPVSTRKTSTVHALRNDASKRFENEISPELAWEGIMRISALVHDLAPHAHFGGIEDQYPEPVKPWTVVVTSDYISSLLGVSVSKPEIEQILSRMNIKVNHQDEALALEIPYWRLDLALPQDIAEEVGRIYGYDKVKPAPLPSASPSKFNNTLYWTEKIKDFLAESGYSEVYAYSLTDHGDVEIQNPLASDKGFLRKDLREGIEKALEFNSRNAPLLCLEEIKIFEIGNVFTGNLEEHASLVIGYFNTKSIKHKEKLSWETLEKVVKSLGEKLGVELQGIMESTESGVIFEADLSALIERLPEPKEWDIEMPKHAISFKQFSAYPFMLRDIAVFVPEGVKETELLNLITKEAGELLVRHSLFDVFHKQFPDGTQKISYAFRLVFQSHERTLTDDEINAVMKRITDTMNTKPNWQVR